MAGTLEINERDAWMPPGWVFDNTLELVANELKREHRELARLFAGGMTDASGGFLSLVALTGVQIESVLAAVRAVRRRVADDGPAAFRNPAFYPGFLGQLDALIDMLQRDRRARGQSDRDNR